MAVFEFPVPYTSTLAFNEKPKKFNVLGSLTVDLEELSTDDLTPVASWKATTFPQGDPLGQAGECFWHRGRFMSPILVEHEAPTGFEFQPLRPFDVRRIMMTNDRTVTFNEAFFRSSQPNGYEHALFQETLAEDGWRPETLPRGAFVEDNFALKANSARALLSSLVLVDGNLFHITSEPVLGCIYNSDSHSISFHIRTADKFHEDWEVFRLDRLDDAIAYANDRWPGAAIRIVGSAPEVHDESHLSFNDEAYSLMASARSLIDEALRSLPHLSKQVGMAVVRLNRIVPVFEESRSEIPDEGIMEEIASALPEIRPALRTYDEPRLDKAIERWNLRPSVSAYAFR